MTHRPTNNEKFYIYMAKKENVSTTIRPACNTIFRDIPIKTVKKITVCQAVESFNLSLH
jgi:hypothetical protein